MKKIFPLASAVLCTMLGSVPAIAADIAIKNEVDGPLKSIDCYPFMGNTPTGTIAKDVAAQGTVLVPAEKFKNAMCDRLVVINEEGHAWQFFLGRHGSQLGSASVHLSPLTRNSVEKTQPSLIYEVGTDLHQEAAGIPFSGIYQILSGGYTVEQWKELLPQGMNLGDLQKNSFTFGGYSWNSVPNTIEIQNNVPVSMQFVLPLVNEVLLPMAENFKEGDFVLESVIVDGQKKEIQGQGQEAVMNAFSEYADGKAGSMTLKWESIVVTVTFPADDTLLVKVAKI